ncbi:hypothetical protein L2217_22665, partial [Xanthomonas perforans]|nr:hypothetical protein [Xanthomonas perforans]
MPLARARHLWLLLAPAALAAAAWWHVRAQPAERDVDRAVPVAAEAAPVSAATPQLHAAAEH